MPNKGKKKVSSDSSGEDASDEEVADAGAKFKGTLTLDSRFPVKVTYCGATLNGEICGVPPEYCAWMGVKQVVPQECKVWTVANAPEIAAKLGWEAPPPPADGAAGGEAKTAEAAGGAPEAAKEEGKLMPGGKYKKEAAKEVLISSKQRQKRKFVCTVRGLELFGVKLPDACKIFKKKFSCGASVVETPDNKEEIEIQGDVKDDVVAVIEKEMGVDIKCIFFVDGIGAKTTKTPAGPP